MYSVKDKHDKQVLSDEQILAEINRDRTDEWTDYTLDDLKGNPSEVLWWIDEDYYEVKI